MFNETGTNEFLSLYGYDVFRQVEHRLLVSATQALREGNGPTCSSEDEDQGCCSAERKFAVWIDGSLAVLLHMVITYSEDNVDRPGIVHHKRSTSGRLLETVRGLTEADSSDMN
jgi:hypothetical protein